MPHHPEEPRTMVKRRALCAGARSKVRTERGRTATGNWLSDPYDVFNQL